MADGMEMNVPVSKPFVWYINGILHTESIENTTWCTFLNTLVVRVQQNVQQNKHFVEHLI